MTEQPEGPAASGDNRRSRQRELTHGFRRALGLTALGTLVPGAGLTRTRGRIVGWVLVLAFLAGLGLIAYRAATRGLRNFGLDVATHSTTLLVLGIAFAVGGLVWCISIIATAVQARPRRLDRRRTQALAVFTTLMVALIGSVSYKGAEFALITKETVVDVFNGGDLKPGQGAVVAAGADPWADTERVSVLLLGSDAGVGRSGTRTDSMMVATTDTKTGRTVLISLPRNFEHVPLPESSKLRALWPSGVYGEPRCFRQEVNDTDHCMLNAIWTEVDDYRANHPDAYPGQEAPGRTEIREVISEILGLKIDHTVVIDLRGFQQLIDAMGGVDVNVKLAGPNQDQPLPYGKAYGNGRYSNYFKKSGVQHLNGYEALWYARTRAADGDSQRQSRQRCVVQAVLDQINPGAMIAKYPEIARIARDNIYTDIAADNLGAFAELVERIQGSRITSLGFTSSNGFPHPANPDYELLRELVQKAIKAPAPASTPSGESSTTAPPTGPSSTSTPTPSPSTSNAPADECA